MKNKFKIVFDVSGKTNLTAIIIYGVDKKIISSGINWIFINVLMTGTIEKMCKVYEIINQNQKI